MDSQKVSLDFYAIGNYHKKIEVPRMKSNSAFRDTSNDLLHRNKLSLNSSNLENIRNTHKALFSIRDSKINNNNYLDPLGTYKSINNYSIDNNMSNKEMYNITRQKLYSKDYITNESLNKGYSMNKKDFLEKKFSDSTQNIQNTSKSGVNLENTKILNQTNFYFDKNNKQIIRYPPNFFKRPSEKQYKTKVSRQSPDWFQVVTEEKNKKYDEIISKNEDTISILSRYNKWITVTPKSKNRRYPLEKMKIEKIDETSRIMPKWMQLNAKKDQVLSGMMKSVEYNSTRNGQKLVVLVDKNLNDKSEIMINPNKSIYSIGDCRHNMMLKEDADLQSSKVSQYPKQMFSWDDGKKYVPKFKKDI